MTDVTLSTGRSQTGGGRPTRAHASKPFAGYVRVSRQGDREDERFRSPQFQRELIYRYASSEGLAIRDYQPEVDVSGSKAKRETLDLIVQAIEAGELAGVVVAKLDRLSRLAPRDRVELFERIESAGGEILSASETLDVSTPEGRFAREVFLGVARMQWEKYRDGFAVAKENAIEQGIAIMARAPFGYRFDESHRLEPVEAEADIVREVYALRALGKSYGQILAYFETMTGRSSWRRTMRDMLHNRAYLGELRYAALVNERGHPAIVDNETFEAVQAVNEAAAGDRSGAGSNRATSLLAGIAKCAGCGRGLVRTRTGSRKTYSYKCPADTRHCEARAHVQADELEALVIGKVLGWAGPVADELVELEIELDARGGRDVAEHRLAQAEARLLEWSTNLELEERDPGAYSAGLAARRERVELRRQELAALGEASAVEIARSTLRAALVGDELDVDEKRRLLAVVLEAVLVRRSGGRRVPAAERVEVLLAPLAAPMLAQDDPQLVQES